MRLLSGMVEGVFLEEVVWGLSHEVLMGLRWIIVLL